MDTEFITYKKFYEKEDAEAFAQVLIEDGIEIEIFENSGSLDSLYGDRHFNHQFFVKIKSDDFLRADSLLSDRSALEISEVSKDHYLFDFRDEELFDIVSKPDEWNAFDFQLAKKILSERGKVVNDEVLDLLKKQRLKDLSQPEESQKAWIYGGYIFSMLGGLIGIFIGWHLASYVKALPNGQRVYGYSLKDRRHGRRIWIIGAVMFVFWVTIKIMNLEG